MSFGPVFFCYLNVSPASLRALGRHSCQKDQSWPPGRVIKSCGIFFAFSLFTKVWTEASETVESSVPVSMVILGSLETSALVKKKNIRADGALKEQIVRDIQENFLTLYEASVKYDVSINRLSVWLRAVREKGYTALYEYKKPGRLPKDMGRPKKKKPEEMTELERLRYENERLRAENALLKKVRALVEEREARLREIGRKPSKD